MSDGIGFDFSELDQLAADLGEVPKTMGPFLRSAVQFTATRVKKEAAKSVGRGHWSAAAAAIDYDMHGTTGARLGGISAEVGYNKGKAGGPLGNLREFGAPAQSLAPSNDLVNALHANAADFVKGIEIASRDAERKAGL